MFAILRQVWQVLHDHFVCFDLIQNPFYSKFGTQWDFCNNYILQQKVLLFATKDIFEKLHLSVSQWGKKELAYIIKLLEI